MDWTILALAVSVAFSAGYIIGRRNDYEDVLNSYFKGAEDAAQQMNDLINEQMKQKTVEANQNGDN